MVPLAFLPLSDLMTAVCGPDIQMHLSFKLLLVVIPADGPSASSAFVCNVQQVGTCLQRSLSLFCPHRPFNHVFLRRSEVVWGKKNHGTYSLSQVNKYCTLPKHMVIDDNLLVKCSKLTLYIYFNKW